MPDSNAEYSLADLCRIVAVTPRTVRYYVAQGLLPPPSGAGPATRYGQGHLARLRLIRRLQRQHMPLADIRSRLEVLTDADVDALVEAPSAAPADDSALDYIRSVLGTAGAPGTARLAGIPVPPTQAQRRAYEQLHPSAEPARAAGTADSVLVHAAREPAGEGHDGEAHELSRPGVTPASTATPSAEGRPGGVGEPGDDGAQPEAATHGTASLSPARTSARSQWDRVELAPDVELHIRRPLSRIQNRRVERLIAVARELLEED